MSLQPDAGDRSSLLFRIGLIFEWDTSSLSEIFKLFPADQLQYNSRAELQSDQNPQSNWHGFLCIGDHHQIERSQNKQQVGKRCAQNNLFPQLRLDFFLQL